MNKSIPSLIFLIILSSFVSSYTNCTPSSCPSGYTDNGFSCSGSTCSRNCTIEVCGNNWSVVHSDTNVWFDDNGDHDENDASSSYTATEGRCYNYSFIGPPSISITYIKLGTTGTPPDDCDSEGIGGFFDSSNANNADPWFNTGSRYLGNVGSGTAGNPDVDYLYEMVRGHHEATIDDNYRNSMAVNGFITCAPNSEACNSIENDGYVCRTNCYGKPTYMYLQQGYYIDRGSEDATLYDQDGCGNVYVGDTRLKEYQYIVSASNLINQSEDVSCDRSHEPPTASNVRVLQTDPIAGQDLFCNYTYTDPENMSEQNTTFAWYSNGFNSGLTGQSNRAANIDTGDHWTCTVTPSDGLLIGTPVGSSNNVSIKNSTKHVSVRVGGESVYEGFDHVGNEKILDLNTGFFSVKALQDSLTDCPADSEGYCNISIFIQSSHVGRLNITQLEIFYLSNTTQSNPEQNQSSGEIGVSNSNIMNEQFTNRIIEFKITNLGNSTLTNINWTYSPGSGSNISTSSLISANSGQSTFIYISNQYSDDTAYNAITSSRSGTSSDQQSIRVGSTHLNSYNLHVLNTSGSKKVIGFAINNTLNTVMGSVSWNLNTENGYVVNSSSSASLQPYNQVYVFVDYNFTSRGVFDLNATAMNGSNSDSAIQTIFS